MRRLSDDPGLVKSSTERLFGRHKGRPLRAGRVALLESLLPRLAVTLPEEDPEKRRGLLDLAPLFGPLHGPLILEIGFGGGEHLAAMAKADPGARFLGCEFFLNGVASLLAHLDEGKVENVRVLLGDARCLLDSLPEGSLEAAYLLYPDPWPKKRHAARRFIGPVNLTRLARTLQPGGLLHMASDVEGLAEWMRDQTTAHPAFEVVYDSREAPPGWIPTRYELKGIAAGRHPTYLSFRRLASPLPSEA